MHIICDRDLINRITSSLNELMLNDNKIIKRLNPDQTQKLYLPSKLFHNFAEPIAVSNPFSSKREVVHS